MVVEFGWKLTEERWPDRTEPVAARQVGARLGAKDHRGAVAVEMTVLVSGVGERPGRHLQAEQLHRFDGGQRGRWDAEGQRVERHRWNERPPFGRAQQAGVGGVTGRVEEAVGVPAAVRNLGDGVAPKHRVGPELLDVCCAGKHALHTDDGNVERCRGPPFVVGGQESRLGQFLGTVRQEPHRSGGQPVVQCRHGQRLVAHRGHLADHEHAAFALARLVHLGEAGSGALQALGRQTQPAKVHLLQFGPAFRRRYVGSHQFAPAGLERLDERAGHAAGGVAGGGLHQRGGRAFECCPLKPGHDGAGCHDLLGEQVGGSGQHADGGSPSRQRLRHGRHHGRRRVVVDATGEDHVKFGHVGVVGQNVQFGLPQGEAAAWAHVTAAFATLEDESTGTVGQKPLEEAW